MVNPTKSGFITHLVLDNFIDVSIGLVQQVVTNVLRLIKVVYAGLVDEHVFYGHIIHSLGERQEEEARLDGDVLQDVLGLRYES